MESLNELIAINEHRAACPKCRTDFEAEAAAQRQHDRDLFRVILSALEAGSSIAASWDGLTGEIAYYDFVTGGARFTPHDEDLHPAWVCGDRLWIPKFSRTLADIIREAQS